MNEQQIQAAKQRLSKAENVVRRLRKAVVDAESRDRIAGIELVRLKLELVKAEELVAEVEAQLAALSQLHREAHDPAAASALPAISTAVGKTSSWA